MGATQTETFEQALETGGKVGWGACTDAQAMAGFCAGPLQILVGAVSPKLVWEGAMRRGLTLKRLAALANQGWQPIDELQWS